MVRRPVSRPGDRKDRRLIGQFLGYSSLLATYEFNLRPLGGTAGIDPEWIKDIEIAEVKTPELPQVVS